MSKPRVRDGRAADAWRGLGLNVVGSIIAWGLIAMVTFFLHRFFTGVEWQWWAVGGGGLALLSTGALMHRRQRQPVNGYQATGVLTDLMGRMNAELRHLAASEAPSPAVSETDPRIRQREARDLFGVAYKTAEEYRGNWAVDDASVLDLRRRLCEVAREAYGEAEAALFDASMPSESSFDPASRGEWVDALRTAVAAFIGRIDSRSLIPRSEFDAAAWKPLL
jgi:hypothetical protein